MSTQLIRFLIEATLVWGVLLLFYLFAFRRSADWRGRRRFLLTAFGLGLLIPLLPNIAVSGPIAAARLPADLVEYIVPVAQSAPPSTTTVPAYTWTYLALLTWLLGTSVALIVAGFGLFRHLRPAAPIHECYEGLEVTRSTAVKTPYAFLGRIYLPLQLTPDLERTALLHEAAHLRHGHSAERLLLLLGTIVFWFHPLAWVYARLLSEVHEYEADAEVARHVPVKTYGRQLLQATLAPRLVPALFSSPLKKRITMLTQTNFSRRLGLGHYAGYGILLAFLLVACSGENFAPLSAQESDPDTYTLDAEGAPTFTTETYSTFTQAFYSTVNYPAVPRQRNEFGRVRVRLQISATGEVIDVQTNKKQLGDNQDNMAVLNVVGAIDSENSDILMSVREPDDFTVEVERVISTLGRFNPAIKEGKPVSGILQFDVFFGLED